MPCSFTEEQRKSLPVSLIHDFAELPILLADDKKKQLGNLIIPAL
jgi:hypothetical protein